MAISVLLQGFFLGASLIIAIGAQNAFVLRQGIKRNHIFVTALICTLGDILLIVLGIAGAGSVIARSAFLTEAARWGGASFLIYYGLRSFYAVIKPERTEQDQPSITSNTLKATITTTLAFTFLNPHVYLDTLVLIGGLSAQYPVDNRLWFGLGAVTASVIWFFGLAYGAAKLSPLLDKPITLRILDGIIGVIMLVIARALILNL